MGQPGEPIIVCSHTWSLVVDVKLNIPGVVRPLPELVLCFKTFHGSLLSSGSSLNMAWNLKLSVCLTSSLQVWLCRVWPGPSLPGGYSIKQILTWVHTHKPEMKDPWESRKATQGVTQSLILKRRKISFVIPLKQWSMYPLYSTSLEKSLPFAMYKVHYL